MAKKKPKISCQPGKAAAPKYTQEDIIHASESAVHLMTESAIVRTSVSMLILARRLYMLARSVIDNELQEGWHVDLPELVIQTLVLSAQEKAMENFTAGDVQQALVHLALPYVDVLHQSELEHAATVKPHGGDFAEEIEAEASIQEPPAE